MRRRERRTKAPKRSRIDKQMLALRHDLLRRVGRGDVWVQCARKPKYETKKAAMERYYGGVYRCPHCGWWHTTREQGD